MPDSPGTTDPPDDDRTEDSSEHPGGHRPRHRKPSVDEVFGDVLPDTTGDERDSTSGRRDSRDDEILRDVPPHH